MGELGLASDHGSPLSPGVGNMELPAQSTFAFNPTVQQYGHTTAGSNLARSGALRRRRSNLDPSLLSSQWHPSDHAMASVRRDGYAAGSGSLSPSAAMPGISSSAVVDGSVIVGGDYDFLVPSGIHQRRHSTTGASSPFAMRPQVLNDQHYHSGPAVADHPMQLTGQVSTGGSYDMAGNTQSSWNQPQWSFPTQTSGHDHSQMAFDTNSAFAAPPSLHPNPGPDVAAWAAVSQSGVDVDSATMISLTFTPDSPPRVLSEQTCAN